MANALEKAKREIEQAAISIQQRHNDATTPMQPDLSLESAKPSGKIAARQAAQSMLDDQQQRTLPLFPLLESAMPNHLARSSLFAPIKSGQRQIHEKALMASRGDASIYYSGHQLDMADNDVFLQALRVAQGVRLGDSIYFNRAQFLREIGRTTGRSQYEWLQDSFYRLTSGTVLIQTKRYKAALHLIDGYALDEDTGEYWLRMNPEIIKLFGHMEYGLVDMHTRLRIGRKQDMAKWLQNYVATHEEGKTHVISVQLLQLWSGSTGRLRDFQARSLTKALVELERLGLITDVHIRGDGKVSWLRITQDPQ
ncbi:MAG: replication protein C, IncQ-type [Pseudomonadota bacterium]|nr:replication protein C, IncQ-type [Pseudomonadota bacterium]